jgi:hypothetical protein
MSGFGFQKTVELNKWIGFGQNMADNRTNASLKIE